MKASKIATVLDHCIKNRRSLLIVSQPGMGKSALMEQAAERNGADFMLKHLAIEDPTDSKGMPALVSNGKTTAEFLPFGDLRRMVEAKRPLVVGVDDLIQAPPACQAAFMQMLWGRNIGGKKISDHVIFIGATNDVSDRAGGTGLIEPLKSRWDTIVRMDLSQDDWVVWAFENAMPEILIAHIRLHPDELLQFTPSREIKSYPCPRSWAAVGRWYNEGMVDHEVFSGVVGDKCAASFMTTIKLINEAPNLDAILMDPTGSELPKSPGVMFLVTAGLARKASKGNVERVLKYVSRLPKEFEVYCVRDAVKVTPGLAQTGALCQWYAKNAEVLG